MAIPLFQVDAFTDRPFRGNPAAVCLLEQARDAAWMQAVAGEMNLSETAFLVPEADGYRLRWFTPKSEVKLCGHATLASAHVLFERGLLPSGAAARFHTASGLLSAVRQPDSGRIELDFPITEVVSCEPPAGLVEALGITPLFIGRGDDDYLVEVASESIVRNITPDFGRLVRVACRGVIVTAAASTAGVDFVSRFFAPVVGIEEDPVTGSAHCRLLPYWQKKTGRNTFTAFQASQRGGVLYLSAAGNRVRIAGQAVTVLQGEWVGD